jgi:Ca2+/Na+ antiporter
LWLKIGAVLLVVALAVSWFQVNQTGTQTFALGGYWGTVRTTSTGLRVSTVVQQMGSASSSITDVLGAVIDLGVVILGFVALLSMLMHRERAFKLTSMALLVFFVASVVLVFLQGATLSTWFIVTTTTFYVRFGDLVMGATIIIFLLASFKAQEETVPAEATKPTSVVASPQALRVVRCHACPMRGVCREANVEASYRLESPLKARSGEDYYAEMLRVTMNCPLKKNMQ